MVPRAGSPIAVMEMSMFWDSLGVLILGKQKEGLEHDLYVLCLLLDFSLSPMFPGN